MTRARATRLLVAAALGVYYLVWAIEGISGGLSYAAGRRLAVNGEYVRALPLLERGAVGRDQPAARWLAGQSRLGLFQASLAESRTHAERIAWLVEAYRDTTDAIAGSPASGWYWAALADIYQQRERLARHEHGLPLGLVAYPRIALVGRAGRVAVGLTRLAIEREPTQFSFHDQLAFFLRDHGLEAESLEAVARSAAIQPQFDHHAYQSLDPLPREVLDAFARGARDALGSAPLTEPAVHHLALGKLELMRSDLAMAEREFRAVLEAPASPILRDEAQYNLGRTLELLSRGAEAEERLVLVERHPIFAPEASAALARLAEARGDVDRALALYWRARRERPEQLAYVLAYAATARRAGRAAEALRALETAVARWPADAAVAALRVEVGIEAGDPAAAAAALGDFERRFGEGPETERLRAAVAAAWRRSSRERIESVPQTAPARVVGNEP